MTGPARVQLRRTRGWRKPEGTVVVARPSRWGNPWPWSDLVRDDGMDPGDARRAAVGQFKDNIGMGDVPYPSVDEIRRELAGRDLACWCPLAGPCHADVLLDLANSGRAGRG